jgi:type I restriction enzyme S subunit
MSEWQETEIGIIPSCWTLFTVGELVGNGVIDKPLDGNHGEIHPKGSDFVQSGIPFIMATDINNGKIDLTDCKFIKKEQADSLNKGFAIQGDVLLTHKATLGRTAIVGKIITPYIMLTPQVTYYRVKNKDVLSNKYLKYFFDSPAFQDTLVNHGDSVSKRAYVGITAQGELPIAIPNDIEEQKTIAVVLSSLDDKIDLLHRQNKNLEAMAETLFRQWFIEEAQEGWEEKLLSDVVKVIDNRGKTPPYQDIPTPYPIIEVNALTGEDRLVDYSAIRKYVSEETFNSWFRGHPKKFDSLLSTVGSIGEMSMFLIEEGSIAQNVVALQAVNISPLYLYEFLKSIKDEIKELDIGSVQPSIKVPHLLSMMIDVPPIEKVDLFDVQIKKYLDKLLVNSKQIRTLEKLRDTYLVTQTHER